MGHPAGGGRAQPLHRCPIANPRPCVCTTHASHHALTLLCLIKHRTNICHARVLIMLKSCIHSSIQLWQPGQSAKLLVGQSRHAMAQQLCCDMFATGLTRHVTCAGSVLHLLTAVFGSGSSSPAGSLEQLIPRLWPLFRHPLTRVRLATVQCLQAFLAQSGNSQLWLSTSIMETALR